ncbi:hypothetical protein Tco_1514948 [Tanacetum coccineum]
MSLFCQDDDTFMSTMFLNIDQLQKKLDKDDFQEDGSMAAFWVINRQFQKFVDSKFTLDYDSQMSDKYFAEYTGIEVKQFRETLLQHMSNVKKSVAERTRHQRQYDRRVNKRQMQMQKSNIDTGTTVYANLVVTESSGTKLKVQDESSRSGNDTDVDDANIRPIYDKEPMDKVQLTTECNIFAIGQQHIEQPEIIVEGRVDQYPETCQVKSPMLDSSPDNQTTEYSKQSLESKTTEQTTSLLANNTELKAQIQEKVFAIAALKNDLRKLKGNSVDTKFDKSSVLGKPILPSLRNQSVVRQPNAFKSERAQMSKPNVSLMQNHDACGTKLLRKTSVLRFNAIRAENSNKNVDQKRPYLEPGSRSVQDIRFSPNKTSVVYEEKSPRDLILGGTHG